MTTSKQHDAHILTQFANSLGQHNAHCYARNAADQDAHVIDWEEAMIEESELDLQRREAACYDDENLGFTY